MTIKVVIQPWLCQAPRISLWLLMVKLLIFKLMDSSMQTVGVTMPFGVEISLLEMEMSW